MVIFEDHVIKNKRKHDGYKLNVLRSFIQEREEFFEVLSFGFKKFDLIFDDLF